MGKGSGALRRERWPLLHLTLKVRNPDSTVDDVKIELSHSELKTVIGKMEDANAVVRDLKHLNA